MFNYQGGYFLEMKGDEDAFVTKVMSWNTLW